MYNLFYKMTAVHVTISVLGKQLNQTYAPLTYQGISCTRIFQCSAEAAFLHHCRTNFEYETAKTVPVGHLAHTDFWPVTGLSP